MYNLTFDEMILLAKIVAFISGDTSVNLTNSDKDMAVEIMKKMIDGRWDMTEQQKREIKAVIDLCKEMS